MGKRIWKLAMCALLLVGTSCVISCGGDDDPAPSGSDSEGGGNKETTAMTPLQQKEYMQRVAENLINTLPAADSKALAELGLFINEIYVKGYNWDNVGVWAKNGYAAACTFLSSTEEESGNPYYPVTYKNTFYSCTLLASNFLGKFTASADGQWKYEKSDDLRFIFTDQNGAPCELKLTTSGDVKKVHITDTENTDYKWEYDYNTGRYKDTVFTESTTMTIGIPEKIEINLTQGGNQVMKTTITTQLDSLDGEEFNLALSNLSFSAKTELNNGCQLNLNQMAYTANKSAAISFEMLKNGKSVVTVAISGDPRNLPSCNLSAFTVLGTSAADFHSANALNAYAKIDILGQLQLQGSLSDVAQFAKYISEAENYKYDEKNFKSYINQANGMLNNFGMYFNNTETKQATVRLESFLETGWYNTYWKAEPVIEFCDGSSYSTFAAFFNENDFKNTISAFTNMANQYASLIRIQ